MNSVRAVSLQLILICQALLISNALFYTSSRENDYPRIGKRLFYEALFDNNRRISDHMENISEFDSDLFAGNIVQHLLRPLTEVAEFNSEGILLPDNTSDIGLDGQMPSSKSSYLKTLLREGAYDEILFFLDMHRNESDLA